MNVALYPKRGLAAGPERIRGRSFAAAVVPPDGQGVGVGEQ
jgi:hypothetical protein